MRHVVSLLCALSLLGCGEGLPSVDGATEPVSVVEQAADVPGTHGYEIELPIWNAAFVPSNWETYSPPDVGWLIRSRSGPSPATMDWGGGNALYNILESHLPYLDSVLAQGTGYQVLGHVTGFFSNIQNGKVRGSVQFETSPGALRPEVQDEVVLALQTFNGTTWTDAAVRSLPLAVFFYGEVEAILPPNIEVRFEIRMRQRPEWQRYVAFTAVRMFGAQCYPDFANAGSCL
ncbi:hypothetical protein [Myxococcus stipitatus]|uniref:hypothetical protein n=1 Tax=Myxococcus stipitatus TaxID=83455 RepID=UPI0030D4DE35